MKEAIPPSNYAADIIAIRASIARLPLYVESREECLILLRSDAPSQEAVTLALQLLSDSYRKQMLDVERQKAEAAESAERQKITIVERLQKSM